MKYILAIVPPERSYDKCHMLSGGFSLMQDGRQY